MSETPLDGLQFLLCRECDALKTKTTAGPCCRNLAYYRNGKLWCADCKRPRGRLSEKVIATLLVLINTMPGVTDQTFILRDKSELPANDYEEAADSVERDT